MVKINANHYTDLIIYSVNQTLIKIKINLNQYILGLGINITSEQFAVLDTIYNHQDICQRDVGTMLSKDKSNVKRIVEILKKRGLITITLGKRSNCAVNFLQITENGKILIDENIGKIRKHIAAIFQNISDDETQILNNIMRKANNKLSKIE